MNSSFTHSSASSSYDFDVIVVGGGHAGIEASYAAARLGSRTLLLTMHLDHVGLMSCNPAIGGIGKGHIVFELSALGGLMPQLCTQTYLQARMLNTRKGPAVHGLRLQIDKPAYSKLSRQMLENTANLTLIMGMVIDLILDDKKQVCGVRTREGESYTAPSVVLTTGTFLNGLIHIGTTHYNAGRLGEESSTDLAAFLRSSGLEMKRLKTGTPSRLLRSSIDFSELEYQSSDQLESLYEFYPHHVTHKMGCYITYTNQKTHDIIKKNLHLSPLYLGHIKGTPPRYCPSIEDKISRFADKSAHHVFVEPESESTSEIYPNGISTSLPYAVQKEFIRSIKGFEEAILVRPGYAVEYDCVLPHQLKHTLEVKMLPGLFLAGQINGTTGYEEAAGQGIIAGINAHCAHTGKKPFIMDRSEGYIGVMIDDLVTLGVDEPYRMFTSRAERRLILRQDNTFSRLADKAQSYGLISNELFTDIKKEQSIVTQTITQLRNSGQLLTLLQLWAAGDTDTMISRIKSSVPEQLSDRAISSIQADILYEPYLKREEKEIIKTKIYQELKFPLDLPLKTIPGLCIELQQKLDRYKPATIAQAALIPGMTPAALSLLIFTIRQHTGNQ